MYTHSHQLFPLILAHTRSKSKSTGLFCIIQHVPGMWILCMTDLHSFLTRPISTPSQRCKCTCWKGDTALSTTAVNTPPFPDMTSAQLVCVCPVLSAGWPRALDNEYLITRLTLAEVSLGVLRETAQFASLAGREWAGKRAWSLLLNQHSCWQRSLYLSPSLKLIPAV